MAQAVTIRRRDVAARAKDALDTFDRLAKRGGQADLVYPDFTQTHALKILRDSPRALWTLSVAKLIPMSEKDALELILSTGSRIERKQRPLAKVQTVQFTGVAALRLRALGIHR